MTLFLILVAVALVGIWWFVRNNKKDFNDATGAPYKVETPSVLDVNKDGKVNLDDAKAVVTKVADVNKDGKVDKADAKEAVQKVEATAKKAVSKAKSAVKAKTAAKAKTTAKAKSTKKPKVEVAK